MIDDSPDCNGVCPFDLLVGIRGRAQSVDYAKDEPLEVVDARILDSRAVGVHVRGDFLPKFPAERGILFPNLGGLDG